MKTKTIESNSEFNGYTAVVGESVQAFGKEVRRSKGAAAKTGGKPVRAPKRADRGSGGNEESAGADPGIGIYLNEIGATQLLSREEEARLGARIRGCFERLLNHLLGAGYVADLLVEQARTEIVRKNCTAERKARLAVALAEAERVLGECRECFGPGLDQNAALNERLAAAFGGLIPHLDVWPSVGMELLAKLEQRHGEAARGGVEGSPEGFAHVNLMEPAVFRLFIKEGARLRAEATAARNEMVDANLRLVVTVAKKMKYAFLSREDLIQEGNCGLLTAAERFDERLGNRFSTFAVNLIKSAMRRENDNQGRTVRLPVHQCDALRRLERAREVLESRLQRAPNHSELAEESGVACEEIAELFIWKDGLASIHELVGEESEATREQFLADPSAKVPGYGDDETEGVLAPYLLLLDRTQREVISSVYGIGGAPRLSLDETAEVLGLRLPEVRRLHNSALASLRSAFRDSGCAFERAA